MLAAANWTADLRQALAISEETSMRIVHAGSGLLLVAVLVAAMVTALIVTGHGSEAPLVVGSVTMVLGPFVGRSKARSSKSGE